METESYSVKIEGMGNYPLDKALTLRNEIANLIEEFNFKVTGSGYDLTSQVMDIGFIPDPKEVYTKS